VRIVFLSPDEPFYLPEVYRRIIDGLGEEHEIRVIIVPPLYKGTTRTGLALRYAKTFGLGEAAFLTARVLYYRIMERAGGLSRRGGRGGGRFYSLRSLLEASGVEYSHEDDLNSETCLRGLRQWKTDLLVSISCPQIFKKDLIDLAPKGCLNLHGSLLPDYRGVMPSFWVLANGEKEAGVTLFYVNEKIDAGDVLIQRRYEIGPDDTLDGLIVRSKRLGAEMVVEAVRRIEAGDVSTRSLEMKKGRYFGWPAKADVRRFIAMGRRFR